MTSGSPIHCAGDRQRICGEGLAGNFTDELKPIE